MSQTLNWGIIATGSIAGTFAEFMPQSRSGKVLAVASRSAEKADRFGDKYDVPRRYGSYEELLADPDVDAVYVSTPHPQHAEWAVKCARAKKHILCEKPIAMNAAEAQSIVDAAKANDVFLMEAFMYRCHPQTRRVVDLIADGAVGQVRMIDAAFSFHAPYRAEGRLFANALGGGGILDIGCYCTSMARLLAGAAVGQAFAEPVEFKGVAHLGESRVDEWAAATCLFPGGVVAQLSCGVSLNKDNAVRVWGAEGNILIPKPWAPAREGGTSTILLTRKGKAEPEEIEVTAGPLYAMEADHVAEHIDRRESPHMTLADTMGNMRALDRWREEIGLVYEGE